MRHIDIDAANWTSIDDFYAALLPAIGAPEGHGASINAIIDSIIGGDMNTKEPPYAIRIHNTASLDKCIFDHILLASEYLAKARAETRAEWGRDMEATIDVVSGL